MKIIIKGTHLDVTPALREYIHLKLLPISKFISSFEAGGEKNLKVEVARTTRHHIKGDVFYVELSLPIGKKVFYIEQRDQDVRAAIDKSKDRLKLELKRFNEKTRAKDRRVLSRLRLKG